MVGEDLEEAAEEGEAVGGRGVSGGMAVDGDGDGYGG
jgi:hypothetical protein